MMNKKGDGDSYKYYVWISLVLGFIILVIFVYWVFQEYFSSDEINRESCRQSIILRNILPEADTLIGTISSKESLPLECKTNVVNIKYKNETKLQKDFMNALSDCWYLVGEGKYHFFKTDSKNTQTRCLVCARIHIDSGVADYYKTNKVDLLNAFLRKTSSGKTYWDYFFKGDIQALPFPRIWDNDKFEVLYGGHSIAFWGKGAGETILIFSGIGAGLGTIIPGAGTLVGTGAGAIVSTAFEVMLGIHSVVGSLSNTIFDDTQISPEEREWNGKIFSGPGFIFPRYFDGSRGDLFIIFSNPSTDQQSTSPFMLFVPQQDLDKLNAPLATYGGTGKDDAEYSFVSCSSYESVPM